MEFKLPNIQGLVEYVAKEVHQRVKDRTPVDTGTAQAGWQLSISGNEATINNDVSYIGYLEDGTSKMAGHNMVRTTLEEVPSIIANYKE